MSPQQNQTPEIDMNKLNQGISTKQSMQMPTIANTNQWTAIWSTKIGNMELKQDGSSVSGTLLQGNNSYIIEGKVVDGVFKGSLMVPSETELFGDFVTFEMSMSSDGKSINFKDFGINTLLNSLNGTKATRQ